MSAQAPFATKTEWVYARLRARIVEGQLPAGSRLRLDALAEELDTSPMPVREALRMLQRDGLVEFESHRGATVADATWSRVYEAVLVRTHLEVLAVREATPHHDRGTVAAMNRLLERMDGFADRRAASAFSDANRRLHSALYEPAPWDLLKEQIRELWDRVWNTRGRSLFALRPDRASDAQDEHRRIVAAVARGDARAAASAAEAHRRATLEAWRSVMPARDGSG
ncbi:MAG: GntR family transcriptional regulator [Actinomycetota bacterium]|nr:GntR family transcriptional regulator [Actinomycetota bacterium]